MSKPKFNLERAELAKQTLIDAATGFYQRGWMAGTAGNLSIRISHDDEPLAYVITASGHEKGCLQPNQFVALGENATKLTETSEKASAETMLHEALYKANIDTQAVYHVHSIPATLLSRRLKQDPECLTFDDLEMLKGLGIDTHETRLHIPVIPNTQNITALSETLLDFIDLAIPGFLLEGHGLYAWGNSTAKARIHIEIWEFLFELRIRELMLGI